MRREHDIKWFMEEPTRLMMMKPFTRGGIMKDHGFESSPVYNNTVLNTGFANLELQPISQDTYITEYRPDLHYIILNQIVPKIKIVMNGVELPGRLMEMTQTASFQKIIHSAHVRSLTSNPLEFTLCKNDTEQGGVDAFEYVKAEWNWRNNDWHLAQAINTCKQLGNCGLLFSFDKSSSQYNITTYSYEDGYQIVPNYDEYGMEIARSLVYQVDKSIVIDTFDAKNHYHITQGSEGWEIDISKHGFSRCPLLHKRGKVAWEYAESTIEIWELMTNIQNIALKRFGTFALVFTGEMDTKSFQRDSSTLIINLSSDTTNGKQDAKVLDFPEPQTMDGYLKTLEEKISLFSSTSFITPKDITATNSGGNGIALAMSNDYALATQSALDWRKFVNDMFYLHQEGLDLENGGSEKYGKLKVSAKIVPWSLETNNTKITNLQMEAKWLSMKTIIERSPDAAPDEAERIISERGALVPQDAVSDADSDKAARISKNNSNEIIDNKAQTGLDN
jgi:hypothetical protein